MELTQEQIDQAFDYAFSDENPGYRSTIVESPDGDGVWDTEKRYAHAAPKYGLGPLMALYSQALWEANQICRTLQIPRIYWPGPDSTLRFLHYPPGATTAPHADWNLFTTRIWRSDDTAFRYLTGAADPLLTVGRRWYPGLHFGSLMAEIGVAAATRHEVVPHPTATRSIVFFAVPHHEAQLPSGLLVGEWLASIKERTRKQAL